VIDALCDELPSLISEAMHPSHVSLGCVPSYHRGEAKHKSKGLALAEEVGTVVVTADHKLLKTQGDPPYVHLGHPLVDGGNLVSGTR